MGKVEDDKVYQFLADAYLYLVAMFMADDITWLTARQLKKMTEEDYNEFLGRDPKKGNFKAEQFAEEVYANFIDNQNYYYDKLQRLKLEDPLY